ncbi:hypothetical protein IW261DRAFT_1571381 [Armillaria novae-zelandiae]|uniref:Zn(2)-C6 fungal-type domain-containing protein n=1 Tax=Armillaria novae-zelandiae TaxID=153914 RepID=A0AA39TWC4_9AGAR|nr:hypothetical protein IW261DRAFT_1571381 [Armillaria novae-zelandiae]
MTNAYRWSQTPEVYEVPATPEDLEVDELSAFYAGRDEEEELYRSAMEAHEITVHSEASSAVTMEVAQQRAQDRAKKLQELKLKLKKEAAEKRAEEERLAREGEERRVAAEKKAVEKKRKEEAAAVEAKKKRLAAEQTKGDDEEAAETADNEKEKACEELRRRRKEKGKAKATGATGPLNKRKLLTRSAVEESEDERTMGPSEERPAKKMKGKALEWEEFHSSDKCGRCRADGAHCIMSATMRSCERCRIRKAKCLWTEETEPTAMEEVVALLHSLHARFDDVEERLEKVEKELASVGGRVDDLVDDFEEGDAIEYPQDFVPSASKEEWKVLREELGKLKGANSEALRRAMHLRLDQDVAQLWYAHMTSMEFNGKDPFELANMELWHGNCGNGDLDRAIVASMRFRDTRAKFYRIGGHRRERLLWKEYLRDTEEFLVEDSEGELEEEEVRAEMLPGPGANRVPGIADLLRMIKGKEREVEGGEAGGSADA